MLSYKHFNYLLIENFKHAETLWIEQGHDVDDIKSTIALFKQLNKKNQITGKEKDIGVWMKRPFSDLVEFVNKVDEEYNKSRES